MLYFPFIDGLYFQVFTSLNRSLSLVARQLDNLSEISFVLPSRKKLEKYPLRICFEHYKGLNKYEPAISYVEERFRAHFQRSRDKAQSSKFLLNSLMPITHCAHNCNQPYDEMHQGHS